MAHMLIAETKSARGTDQDNPVLLPASAPELAVAGAAAE
jgi:hypothetical protein